MYYKLYVLVYVKIFKNKTGGRRKTCLHGGLGYNRDTWGKCGYYVSCMVILYAKPFIGLKSSTAVFHEVKLLTVNKKQAIIIWEEMRILESINEYSINFVNVSYKYVKKWSGFSKLGRVL